MKSISLSLLLAFAAFPVVAAPLPAAPAIHSTVEIDRTVQALTNGVREVAAPGLTGVVTVTSSNTFPVVVGKAGKNARAAVAAASQKGNTRIVAFGHDGYLIDENLKVADTARLLDNAILWVAGGQKPARVGVLTTADNDVLSVVKARGVNAVPVTTDFTGFNTLVVNGHALKEAHRQPLADFLARGGGLVIATTGWGWNYYEPNLDLARDFVGNAVLAPYGLLWTNGQASKTSAQGFQIEPISPYVHAATALRAIREKTVLTPTESEQASVTLGNLVTALPPTDTVLYPQLREIALGSTGEVVPFERAPIREGDTTARLLLMLQTTLNKNQPAEAVKPHPAGAIFPGDVPPNAKPVTKTLSIDTATTEWHSTGLYAAPGATITVTLPAGVSPDGLGVRIGAHSDALYHLDTWKRAPEISRTWPLGAGASKVANPFGGLVYILVPGDAAARTVEIAVSGAHAAPLWVQGQTTVEDWKNTIRWAPAPWAEINTGKMIVTVPSRSVRDLEDPTAVADFYNKGMDAAFSLYGAMPRRRPERIVADVQISAGYMHSGYPIMTWLDVEKTTVDAEQLKKFPWGHWHEVGHNFQKGEWTFGGTGETTNNLLPLYVWNVILGQPINTSHPALKDADRAARWAKYDAGGRKFEQWQSDPWLALEMYLQLQNAFGWEPFKKAFAEYETLTDAQKPKTEEQKHDEWMVRMARATGKNLGPFFEKWGVPTSAAARASIANLPAWMPEFPKAP